MIRELLPSLLHNIQERLNPATATAPVPVPVPAEAPAPAVANPVDVEMDESDAEFNENHVPQLKRKQLFIHGEDTNSKWLKDDDD